MEEVKTCGTCRHWVDGGPDPEKVGQPHEGQCRAVPPGWQLLPLRLPTGHSAVETRVMYPPVDAAFAACGLHEEVGRGLARP